MPERLICDQAIQFARTRLKVSDPDLVNGHVEMLQLPAGKWEMPRPWGLQGGFAVVYKFRTRSGKLRALRCFHAYIKPDIQQRYEQIGPYFAQHIPEMTVECRFYPQGILIGEGQEKRLYPLIDMEWVDGLTLLAAVEECCRKRDQDGLARLVQQWERLVRCLRQARIAHGDLAGENVMVRSDGRLVLVDYDGVYIPGLENLGGIVEGQPDYQHHEVKQRHFDEKMDTFSSLVIYTALLVLQARPELWQFAQQLAGTTLIGEPQSNRQKRDGGLLFARSDFLDPDSSTLFQEILRIGEERVHQAVEELRRACRQHIEQVQFPTHLFDPDYEKREALAKLKEAIQGTDEAKIVEAWNASLFNAYAPAQMYVRRVEQARQIIQALRRFREALATREMQQIITAYDPLLDRCVALSERERRCLSLSQQFVEAMQGQDEQHERVLLLAWEGLQQLPVDVRPRVGQAEERRVALVRQRNNALQHFQAVLAQQGARGQAEEIVAAYHPLLDESREITAQQRARLDAARHFLELRVLVTEALQAGTYEQAVRYYDEDLFQQFSLTATEEALIEQASLQIALEQAIQEKDHSRALNVAQRLELVAHRPLKDYRLAYVRRKFIRQFDITSLEARLHGEMVSVRWRWPGDELVRYAVIAWRVDHWPRSPQRAEPGTGLVWFTRNGNEQIGSQTFVVGFQQQIYLHAYLAIPDETSQSPTWFYSSGSEPGSRQIVRSGRGDANSVKEMNGRYSEK